MYLELSNKTVYIATGNQEIDPDKESVVFIHGAGQDHTIWILLIRYFARHGKNVLAVDLPGHGRSDGPPLPSIEAMSDWVVKLLDEVGVQRAALVGHSMGTLVAVAAAGRHPHRVRALALVATSIPMPVTDALLETAANDDPAAVEMLTLWGHSRSAHLGGNPTPGMWMLGGGRKLLDRAASGVIHSDLQACNAYADGLQHAAKTQCPAMLILGNRDAMTPVRSSRELVDALPHSEVVVLDGAGHALLAERPDPVLDAVIRVV